MICRIQRKITESMHGRLHAILKTTDCYFCGRVEQKRSGQFQHAEIKKINLSIPCVYICLGYLPSFTFQC